ncbi:hypothetical protein QTP70_016686 [Hemibagrus guttatus]|uniref:Uncharacterized protein n=1 Tax=Hemibagrus guttatus TaxID=175788 RepID=A0AAE0RJL9_9TELE|nr:hypothetical protein QTP70_016686 [Hemibagrus guttatus]
MPVKRRIQVEDKENTPGKRHTRDKNYSPLTGTKPMTPTAKTQASKVNCEVNATQVHEKWLQVAEKADLNNSCWPHKPSYFCSRWII